MESRRAPHPSCATRSLAAPLLAAALFLGFVGCATTGYVVTLRDGRQFISADQPVLNPKTGYYKFRDRYGRDVLMREQEVLSIETGADAPRS